MMSAIPFFNPKDTASDLLEAISVGREGLLQQILASIRSQATEPRHQHWLVLGPLGMGKSHLVALLYHRLRQSDLSKTYLPVWLPEAEHLRVGRSRCLLSSALLQLQKEYPKQDLNCPEWLPKEIKKLRALKEPGERFAQAQALLHDACEELDRKVILLVENFDEMLRRIGGKAEQRRLRKFLQEDGAMLLVATSPLRALETDSAQHPLFQHFATHVLEGLDADQTEALVRQLGEQTRAADVVRRLAGSPGKVRLVRALTGGNPRLIIMLFDAASGPSGVSEVHLELKQMLDQQTRYFESRLEQHGQQEQEVLGVFCEADRNLSPTEAARALGMEVNQVSAIIGNLCKAGALEPAGAIRRRDNLYAVADDLLRIWYQYRFGEGEGVIQRLVSFLALWYQRGEIHQMISWGQERMVQQGLSLLERSHAGETARYGEAAAEKQEKLARNVDKEAPAEKRLAHYQAVIAQLDGDEDLEAQVRVANALRRQALLLLKQGHLEEARKSYEEVIIRFGEKEEFELENEALISTYGVIALFKAQGNFTEALKQCEAVIERHIDSNRSTAQIVVSETMNTSGAILFALGRRAEARQRLEEVIARYGNDQNPFIQRSALFSIHGLCRIKTDEGDHSSALALLEQAIQQHPQYDRFHMLKALILRRLGQEEESKQAWATFLEMIQHKPFEYRFNYSDIEFEIRLFLLHGIGPDPKRIEQFSADLEALLSLPDADNLGLSNLEPLRFVGEYFDQLSRPQQGSLTPEQRAQRVLDRVPRELREAVEGMVQEAMALDSSSKNQGLSDTPV